MQAFQNGRFALLEIPSQGKRFSLQDRSERCLFLSATVHELKKMCEIWLVGKSLRVSLPLFWIRTCSENISKTIKGTNSSTETAEHLSSDISRRYCSDGKNRGILMSRNTLIFLLQHLGFVINLRKSVLTPSQQIEFLGLTIDTYTMTVALTEEKMEKAILKFLLSHLQTTLLELTADVLNCPSSSASSSAPKVFKTTTNTITKPGLFIPGRDIKQLVKTGTSLVGEKQ